MTLLYYILLIKASYKASVELGNGGTDSTFQWEDHQNHIAKRDVYRSRQLTMAIFVNTFFSSFY